MSPARCSVRSAELGEPLAGTAPLARTWVVLEQPGPYGRKALTESHLAPEVGAALTAAAEGTGVTVLLARAAGPHHADDHRAHERRFWIAHVSPGGSRMRAGRVADLRELVTGGLRDELERAGRGELPAWGSPSTTPLLLVCSNGRRDLCCAVAGHPLATGLAADPAYSEHVVEVSHLGGHRFAPTAVLLPTGMAYGRLTPDTARAAIDAAARGEVTLAGARGLTALPAPMQVADLRLREHAALPTRDELVVLRRTPTGKLAPAPLGWDLDGQDRTELVGRHQDGRAWRVVVRRERVTPDRSESCRKAEVTAYGWVADEPAALENWR